MSGHSAENGLRACTGCGIELDADDRHDHCEECEQRAAENVAPREGGGGA